MCGGGNLNSVLAALAIAGEQPFIRGNELKEEPKPRLICWHCKNRLSPEFSWCPICGSAVKPVPCSYCGQMIGIKEDYCPHCGAPKQVENRR